MKYLLTATGLLSLLVYVSSCDGNATDTGKKEPVCISDSMMRMIAIDTVQLQNVNDELKLSGEVSFNENKVVKVYPISSGQVLSVALSVGDYVHAGQTLATIKSADIAGSYADLSSAGADIAIAKRAMDNAKHLYDNGIGSEREYAEAKENYEKALTGAHKIRQQITINGGGRTSANGTYVVTAPKSGYVVEKNINPGQFIRNDNGENMFTVGDTKDVWIWANVYESDIARVKEGYTALVTTLAYPDSVFTGKVDKVNQILDPQTKVMKIKIVLPNPKGSLKPEMFANIVIQHMEGKKTTAIPVNAVVSENGKDYAVVYHNKCHLEIRPVHIAKTVDGLSFIDKGLQPGENIISSNQILIYRQLQEAGNNP